MSKTMGAINSAADRWKICPLCSYRQPIAEFLYGPVKPLRTVVKYGEERAYIAADVQEWCVTCSKQDMSKTDEDDLPRLVWARIHTEMEFEYFKQQCDVEGRLMPPPPVAWIEIGEGVWL